MHRKNKKYKSLTATAKGLFWKYGFKRVSIEEICREASVSKMTFYKYFKNKEEIACTILDTVYDGAMDKFRKVWDTDMSMEERFQSLILMKAEASKDLSMEFVKDLYANPESDLAIYMQKKTQVLYAEMIDMYKKGQEKGWIRKDLNVEFLFFYMQNIITLIQGDEAQKYFETSQDLILEVTRLIIYGMHPSAE